MKFFTKNLAYVFAIGSFTVLESESVFADRSTNYTYNSQGQVLTVDGSRTDVIDLTTYTYDVDGNRASETNALGQITKFNLYDGVGSLLSFTDQNGITTLLSYDERKNPLSVRVKHPTNSLLDKLTQYQYDPVGLLIGMTLPNGYQIGFEYDDARRLKAIKNSSGERVEYALDSAGNRTQEIVKDATGTITYSIAKVYDELNRLIKINGNHNQITTTQYDSNDNKVSELDAKQNKIQNSYDELNRLTKIIDPNLNQTQIGYDSQGRVKFVVDARNTTTTYSYDGFGNLISRLSPDSGITTFTYDTAGNRLSATDARLVVTNYKYDALNRLVSITYPSAPDENVIFSYDSTLNGSFGVGRLSSVSTSSARNDYEYNYLGLVTKKYSLVGSTLSVTQYTYDTAGNLTGIVYPTGRSVSYILDAAGRVQSVTTKASLNDPEQIVLRGISYIPYGPSKSFTYGNGLSHTMVYDSDYRISSILVGGIFSLSYGFDVVDNISNITDGFDSTKTQTFTYDQLNRLASAKGKYGTLSYTYDSAGNRLTEKKGSVIASYSYEGTSNHLLGISKTNANRNFIYDAVGNVIQGTNDALKEQTFTFNNANRLSNVSVAGVAVGTYTYNALGQRVSKVAGTKVQELYHYDEMGQLIAVTDFNGIPLREYIYKGNSLVGLNTIKTVTSAIPSINATADQASLMGAAALSTAQTGYTSPTGFIQFSGEGQASWSVTVGTATTYKSAFTYSMIGSNRAVDVYLDGVKKTSISFVATTDLNTWTSKSVNLNLTAGAHTIALKTKGQSAPNVDKLIVSTTTKLTTTTQTLYYVHNDHHNTPQVVTNQSGQVSWMADYQPFGKTTIVKNDLTEIFSRFSGQFYDPETGLYQNYFRDYDPSIGRYIESDPIGLGGGLNTYTYVSVNPLRGVDPKGLAEWWDQVKAVGPYDASKARDDALEAYQTAQQSTLKGKHNGDADAFRHCLWSCLMTQHIGEDQAKAVGDTHEENGNKDGQPKSEENMDKANNAVGRQCGLLNDDKPCPNRCLAKLRNGDLFGLDGVPIPPHSLNTK